MGMKQNRELQQRTFTQRLKDEEVGVSLANQLVTPRSGGLSGIVRITRESPMLTGQNLADLFLE